MQLLDDDDLGTMMEICLISQHREFDFDLNVEWIDQLECGGTSQMPENPNYGGSSYNNPTLGPRLQIHLEVIISTKADVGEMTNNGEDFNQDIEDFSDPDIDVMISMMKSRRRLKMLTAFHSITRVMALVYEMNLGDMLSIDQMQRMHLSSLSTPI
ncbi:hypothetical protein Gotur_011836 [Gossypium turneri]